MRAAAIQTFPKTELPSQTGLAPDSDTTRSRQSRAQGIPGTPDSGMPGFRAYPARLAHTGNWVVSRWVGAVAAIWDGFG